jgi:ABC-type uncharacterized transport system fused permease/ATPase subunit
MITREQEAEYRFVLRQARSEAFGVALHSICENELEKVKEQMLDIPDWDTLRMLQGEGRAFRKILKFLTERAVSSPPEV